MQAWLLVLLNFIRASLREPHIRKWYIESNLLHSDGTAYVGTYVTLILSAIYVRRISYFSSMDIVTRLFRSLLTPNCHMANSYTYVYTITQMVHVATNTLSVHAGTAGSIHMWLYRWLIVTDQHAV